MSGRATPVVSFIAAGLMGAAGLGLQALGAHAAGDPVAARRLTIGGSTLLAHAPVILILAHLAADSAKRRSRRALAATMAMLFLGALLFAAALAISVLSAPDGWPVLRLAPVGGTLMIGGWAALAFLGLARLRKPPGRQ